MKFRRLLKKLGGGGKPLLAVLVDPDKFNAQVVHVANKCAVACFLVGGSKLKSGSSAQRTVKEIKKLSRKPVILFPGDETQLTSEADGLLLLSLLSGRNPEYLIEKHIRAAPLIRKMKLPHLSTAYILIGGGKRSATEKITGTRPLDPSRPAYIVNTAIAAGQLGFRAIYLEAGSGAADSVKPALIKKVRDSVDIPLIIGGGIDSAARANSAIRAGADMVVVGNALEKNVYLLNQISACFRPSPYAE
jgi:phosphoglycerol geranylgeranyltransferase